MTQPVSYQRFDTHGVITLDDSKANAFSFEMIKALNACLDEAEKDAKVIVLAGREGKFCAGFDLATMKGEDIQAKERLLDQGFCISYRLMNSTRPVIAACTGHALAMGAVLLLSCDYRVGVKGNAKLGLNEIAIGVEMPEYGVDIVQERIARPYQVPALANAVLYGPTDAVSAGFLDEEVEADKLMERTEQIAAALSQIDMNAHVNVKRALRANFLAKYKNRYGG